MKKITNDLDEKIKSDRSRLVVVGPQGGGQLTVIDGVHRAIRICLYYFVQRREDPRKLTQEAYLGLTPDPIPNQSLHYSKRTSTSP